MLMTFSLSDLVAASAKDRSSIVTVGGRLVERRSESYPRRSSELLLLRKALPGLSMTVFMTTVSIGNVVDVAP